MAERFTKQLAAPEHVDAVDLSRGRSRQRLVERRRPDHGYRNIGLRIGSTIDLVEGPASHVLRMVRSVVAGVTPELLGLRR
ncbi:MAG TPA: hypothetical protein VF469_23365 [Kofleriaceae bacterium]